MFWRCRIEQVYKTFRGLNSWVHFTTGVTMQLTQPNIAYTDQDHEGGNTWDVLRLWQTEDDLAPNSIVK